MFQEYNAGMAELLADADERAAWQQETTLSEASAADTAIERAQAITR
jgi:soluble cytochrome b562